MCFPEGAQQSLKSESASANSPMPPPAIPFAMLKTSGDISVLIAGAGNFGESTDAVQKLGIGEGSTVKFQTDIRLLSGCHAADITNSREVTSAKTSRGGSLSPRSTTNILLATPYRPVWNKSFEPSGAQRG